MFTIYWANGNPSQGKQNQWEQEAALATIIYVNPQGERQEVDVPDGENVMRAALYNDVDGIVGECGGGLSCATCHVYVDEEWRGKLGGPANSAENELLDQAASEVRPSSRLSCQIQMTSDLDGLVVHLPEQQY